MNKLALALVLLVPAIASADDEVSPYGTSPFVVAYQPPPKVERAHRGLTLEVALAGGSTSVETSTGGATFAIGGWLSHDFALAFRATDIGSFTFAGVSAQYFATHSLWLGGGIGGMSERSMDAYGGYERYDGTGVFARGGGQIAASGVHALYLSAELQAGVIDGVQRETFLLAIGYQLL